MKIYSEYFIKMQNILLDLRILFHKTIILTVYTISKTLDLLTVTITIYLLSTIVCN